MAYHKRLDTGGREKMSNLLEETKKKMAAHGKQVKDVVFIGSLTSGYSCSWPQFRRLSDENYDQGFGHQKVATDLVIVFKDASKLERREYDGAEWWEYSCIPQIPDTPKPISRLIGGRGESLEGFNRR